MQIYQLERGVTADYASEELAKYIRLMCGERSDIRYKKGENGIILGLFDTLGITCNDVGNVALDDVFEIKVDGFSGYIAGSNIRSILFGVYAYLKKAGCRFIRPGIDGDYVPEVDLSGFKTFFRQKAHYRYRTDCIEGTVSYDVLRDHIEWLAKIGFNGYMLQGTSPYLWYDRWFNHDGNKYKVPESLSIEEADIITGKVEMDIKRCGLDLHSVGHDYMGPAFGLFGNVTEEKIDELGMRDYIALVNGKRKIMYNHIRYTNLCFLNAEVRKKLVDYFVKYITDKPYVDYLHIWFADGINNNCECENCRDISVSDMYISILNDVDKAFTKKGINTRIVFEMYNDSCWAPVHEKLNNPDRFVFMPAIRQNFIDGYAKYDDIVELPEYRLNNNTLSKSSFSLTMAFWREWQKVFKGDCFFFDYHLYSDHYCDPGYCQISSRLMRDTKLLDTHKSQGIMHCSSQRKQMPNSYPMYMSGEILMNPSLSEDAVIVDYFSSAYGDDWKVAYEYLKTLSELFQADLVRNTGVGAADEMYLDENVRIVLPYMNNPAALEKFKQIDGIIKGIIPVVEKNLKLDDTCRRKSWDILRVQIPIISQIAEGLCAGASGDMKMAQDICRELVDYLAKHEDEYYAELDFGLLYRRLKVAFGFTDNQFASIKEGI